LGKNFPKEEDSELAKIQTATLLPGICMEFIAAEWSRYGPGHVCSEVITMIQQTICLIGNTSKFISQTRHSRILETL